MPSLSVVRGGVIAGSTMFVVLASVTGVAFAQNPPQAAPTVPPAAPSPLAPSTVPAAAPTASTPAAVPPVAPVAPAPAPMAPAPAPVAPAPAPMAPAPAPAAPAPSSAATTDTAAAAVDAHAGVTASGGALTPPPIDPESSPEPEPSSWYEGVNVGAFIDSYFSQNWNAPKPQTERNRFRAYDHTNGFAISWVGADVSYDGGSIGGTLSLRFGPTAERFAGPTETSAGLHVAKQAYATWKPGGADSIVSLDFGKFDTIYGAEVAESQLNFNYTRGMLNWVAQPFFHTGLRANFDVSEHFWVTALAVNGWNNSIDNNSGKSFGIQLSTAVPGTGDAPLFEAHLGYLVGPERVDVGVVEDFCTGGETLDPRNLSDPCNRSNPAASADRPRDAGESNTAGLRHFIDLVVGLNPTEQLAFLINADYGIESVRDGSIDTFGDLPDFVSQSWWGVSAMGRYAFSEQWAGALRGEILGDPDGRATSGDDDYVLNVQDLTLGSATLTVDYAPAPPLLLRLDNRLDFANDDVFRRQVRSYSSTQFTTTLGVVVTTN